MFLVIIFIPESHAFARPRTVPRTLTRDGAAPFDGRCPRTCTTPGQGVSRDTPASQHKRAQQLLLRVNLFDPAKRGSLPPRPACASSPPRGLGPICVIPSHAAARPPAQ
eukprot:4209726-Pleurochrysis_carterae.AAC.1